MNADEQDGEYHWEMNEYGLQTVVKSPSANKTKSSATAAASLNPSKVATSEMQRAAEIEHGIPKTSKDNEKAQPAIALDVDNNNESVQNPVGSKASSPAIQMNNAIEMINHARDASSSGNASGSESNSSLYDEAKDETKINVVRRRNKNTSEAKNEIGETTACEASTINVVVDDQKKINSVVSKTKHFPVSSSNIGCCACLKRLCCHGLTDTDDLILRRERERLNKHLDKEDEVLSGQDKCMMV